MRINCIILNKNTFMNLYLYFKKLKVGVEIRGKVFFNKTVSVSRFKKNDGKGKAPFCDHHGNNQFRQ